jgi:thioredoxin 1
MANSKNVAEATDTNFEGEVLKGQGLAMVDFWAEWCGPCRIRMLAPTIDSLAEDYQGKIRVYKMNVDENPSTPTRFHIRGIPMVIFFKDGQAVDQLIGNQPKDAFVETIAKHLK